MIRRILMPGGMFALIDDIDYPRVRTKKWHAAKRGRCVYAASNEYVRGSGRRGQKTNGVYLHRFVLDVASEDEVDHRNGNGLDCRRSNLRRSTRSQNGANARKTTSKRTSRFKGVCLHKATGLWRAYIVKDRTQQNLGYFRVEQDAARAYDTAARLLFGDFARLNYEGPE